MSERIYFVMRAVLNVLDGGWIFLISVVLALSLFLSALLLSLLKTYYGIKKRAWFFPSALAVLAIELAFLSLENELELAYLSLGITLILSTVILLLPVKGLKIKDSDRELARFIDDSVKKAQADDVDLSDIQSSFNAQPDELPVRPNGDDAGKFELDFQHVKRVLQKLEYYPLTPSDKKTMRELEESIYQAESQGLTSIIKGKINDGLGALLKIMSKYGV